MMQVNKRPDETQIGLFEREGSIISLSIVAAWSNEEWIGLKLYDHGGRKRVYYLTIARDGARWKNSKDLPVLDKNFPKARAWIEKQVREHNGKTTN